MPRHLKYNRDTPNMPTLRAELYAAELNTNLFFECTQRKDGEDLYTFYTFPSLFHLLEAFYANDPDQYEKVHSSVHKSNMAVSYKKSVALAHSVLFPEGFHGRTIMPDDT